MQRLKQYLFLLSLIGFFSCTSSQKMFEDNTNHWLPANFKPQNEILLIEKNPVPGDEEGIENWVKSNYPYKYEFISKQDLKDNMDKYASGNIYTYVLKFKLESVAGSSSTDVHSIDQSGGRFYEYYFYNIPNHKKYSDPSVDSSWPLGSLKRILEKIVKDNPKS
jgi:hypothetical protein